MHDDDDDVKRRVRVRAFANSALSRLFRARALFCCEEEQNLEKAKEDVMWGKKRENERKKLKCTVIIVIFSSRKDGEQVEKGDLFFFFLFACFFTTATGGYVRLRTRFLNRKVYKFYFVISDIIKIQVGCMPVLVRIPQNYSHSLYSLCVFVYVISTVYLFFLYSYIFLF